MAAKVRERDKPGLELRKTTSVSEVGSSANERVRHNILCCLGAIVEFASACSRNWGYLTIHSFLLNARMSSRTDLVESMALIRL
jgi:hypothetical protein